MNKKLLALYGLKWNPFASDVPTEALLVTPRTKSFCWRVGQLAGEGGFALVTGAPSTPTGQRQHRGTLFIDPATTPLVDTAESRRLLSRDGRPVRRRAPPPQPLGRRQGAA